MSRLAVIGIDGMDPYVFEKLRGELPHLASIAESGCFKHCDSVFPPDSIPAWVTIFTGEHPAKHGWLDNIDYEDIRRGAAVDSLGALQGRTFWDQVGQAGKRVVVINPLLAYPVWPVNGIMANGPVFISGEKQISPPALAEKYRLPELGGMTEFPAENELEAFLETTLQTTRELAQFGLDVMAAEPWDLFFISFFTLDRIQHFLWRFWDASDPQYPGPSRLEDAVTRAYKTFDAIVGEFMQRMGENAGLIVMSDHGHGQRPIMLVNLNELLRQEGLLKTSQGKNKVFRVKDAVEIVKNISVKLVAGTLGERWLYRIGRLLPKKTRKALKKSSYLIDKEASAAWVSDMGGGASVGGIVINPKIDPRSPAYQDTARRIRASLEKINQPPQGRVIQWADAREEGSFYPDIIFELDAKYSVGRSLFCPLVEKNPRHRIISGGHKKEGVFFARAVGDLASRINTIRDISQGVVAFMLSE
jgi:predicted AlkP superfamily phosphohydrolase/phosphomutase